MKINRRNILIGSIVLIITGSILFGVVLNLPTYKDREQELISTLQASPDKALELARLLMEKYPDQYVPYHIAANIYTLNEDFTSAEEMLQKAIEHAKPNAILYTRMAYFYKRVMPSKLPPFMQKILQQKIETTYPELPAHLYIIDENYNAAIEYLENQLQHTSAESLELLFLLQKLYTTQEQSAKARKLLFSALEQTTSPESGKELLDRILELQVPFDREEIQACLAHIIRSAEALQGYYDKRYELHSRLVKLIKLDKALHIADLLQHEVARKGNNDTWIWLSTIYLQEIGQSETAYAMLQNVSSSSNNPYLLEEKTYLAGKTGQSPEEIIQCWKKLRSIYPDDIPRALTYARELNKVGKRQESLTLLSSIDSKDVPKEYRLLYISLYLENSAIVKDYANLVNCWIEAEPYINFQHYQVLQDTIFGKLPETSQHKQLYKHLLAQRSFFLPNDSSSILLEIFITEQLRDEQMYFKAAEKYLSKKEQDSQVILYFVHKAMQQALKGNTTLDPQKIDPEITKSPVVQFAHKWLSKLVKKYPYEAEYQADLLVVERLLGKNIDIPQRAKKILKNHENDHQYVHLVAYTLSRAGYPEQALPYYEQAIRLQPEMVRYHITHAGCLMQLQKYQQAIDAYYTILTRSKTSKNWDISMILHNLWTCYEKTGKLGRFYSMLTTLSSHPKIDKNEFYNAASSLLMKKHQLSMASGLLEKYLTMSNDKEQAYAAYLKLAQLYAMQKKFKAALSIYTRCEKKYQTDLYKVIDCNYNKAEIFRRQGNFKKAIQAWKNLAYRYPEDPEARDSLLEAAEVAHKNLSDNDLMRQLYHSYIELHPDKKEAEQLVKDKIEAAQKI